MIAAMGDFRDGFEIAERIRRIEEAHAAHLLDHVVSTHSHPPSHTHDEPVAAGVSSAVDDVAELPADIGESVEDVANAVPESVADTADAASSEVGDLAEGTSDLAEEIAEEVVDTLTEEIPEAVEAIAEREPDRGHILNRKIF